ncbi:alginate lyase family protein [Mucilaginibacter lacusdianchii]|uniref:alginate lyase family protein n=1 Tax=Mucilaginibacter lacusdianchii TaxID=2684211 RepID=UPI00131B9B06|nr:alginate lyase family protein [Mucilaginibacter sp. JXJ CY 39]
MRKWITLILSLVFFAASAHAQLVSLTDQEVRHLKNLIDNDTTATAAFMPLRSVAEQSLLEQPNPIVKISLEGLLAGDPAKTASLRAMHDADKIYAMALMYRLYGNKTYLGKTIEFLQAWAQANRPFGNPINDTKLEALITGYDLIRAEVPAEQKLQIDNWLNDVANAELNSFAAKPGRGTAVNNWNSHRIKIITLIAYTLHNSMYDTIIKTELEKQIAQNLNANGTSIDFIERDAFHYHTYDLEPLLTAIIAIKRASGKSYFEYQSDKEASIKKSVDFIIPYMTGEKQHAEFVKSRVPFDRARAANHEKGFEAGTPVDPQIALYTLALAAYFDKDYIDIIKQVSPILKPNVKWQLILNQVKR